MRKSIVISSTLVAIFAFYFYGLPYLLAINEPKLPDVHQKEKVVSEEKAATNLPKLLVQVTKSGFQPSSIKAKSGQRIEFYNASGANIKLVSDSANKPAFGGKVIPNNTYYTVSFNEKTMVNFYNEINVSQKGSITVE
ncbi:MAG TPA: hypothetical protein VF272_01340 [Candidatus Saccharimonadia bacterium]